MRGILLIVGVVILLAVAGWLTFTFSDNRGSVNLELEKIEQDTKEILQSGKELANQASEGVDQAVTTDEESQPAP